MTLKRLIIWIGWGERYVNEAIESARSAAAVDADRLLLTDLSGATQAQHCAAFTAINRIELKFRNLLEKSRLIDLIPEGYDSVLALDTDTRILDDVTFGFEQAERFGIAIASSPIYNLCIDYRFRRIMNDLGITPADQIQYNAGVIFFSRNLATNRVLERWRDLCATVARDENFPHDQQFLSLAFEQIGFTPYVLSPAYNYRAFGELALGGIRIWHSHYSPPADLNAFTYDAPPRRYRHGVRMPPDPEPTEPTRTPQQVVVQSMPVSLGWQPLPGTVASMIAEAMAVQRQSGSRKANEFLLGRVAMSGVPENNEEYFAEAFYYHLGLVHGHTGEFEEMAHRLSQSRTMPSGKADQRFVDHVEESRVLRSRQLTGIARDIPAIPILSMPHSGGRRVAQCLGRALGVPVLHLSVGEFPNSLPVPSWLNMFLEGGATSVDEFGASELHIGVLCARPIHDLFVIAGDPRAAARSQVHRLGHEGADFGSLERKIERECIGNFIPWLQGWIDYANDPQTPFRIHWITTAQILANPVATARRMSAVFEEKYPAMAACADWQSLEEQEDTTAPRAIKFGVRKSVNTNGGGSGTPARRT